MSGPGPLEPVEAQQARVLAAVRVLGSESLPLGAAAGRTTAAEVRAAVPIPVFDNSAMDGYAVHAADLTAASAERPSLLPVVADLAAGTDLTPELPQGAAARIMTGAPLPPGADAIVPVEDTDGGVDRVSIRRAPVRGAHIRRAAEDLAVGDSVLAAGVRLTPARLAAAAAAGHGSLEVRRRPRVAVVATGSELVAPGAPLRPGSIHDSNSTLLAGLVVGADAELVLAERVPDDDAALIAALARARAVGVDAIVLSGGASVGAYDVARSVLEPRGIAFRRIAMQPGKPQGFGVLEGVPVFALPGNPVSVAVSFEVFVRPALRTMQGRAPFPPPVHALAAVGWRTPPERRQYAPVALEYDGPTLLARPASAGGSGSHLAGSLALADGFAVVPAERSEVRPGDELAVMLVG
ncbi:gephyrin-like molybdotransferase Glp [Agromyces archimandritae]|uniref:Molybdopterin molybdenumtransferase n=1 Tax=Agromyces archimandritae TaxID=2781962 RepID=A0A975FL38_9MICO|nr:gephyrin-like molybdotransferase Glp [Agromyces archimandritae]QTX03866.1 molybdopterin molybdotransferase MoeA [Agromyces archimandritae]